MHLVLARLPDAPAGVKGLSLFLVPKRLLQADGTPGTRNDVRCLSIEHKLGMHGSPTCVMSYGEESGATGWLVGEANRGLECMFVMMNDARFLVGVQGVGLAEMAWQHALAYARVRIQGRDALGGQAGVPIVRHPDVKRMLLDMRSRVMATRMLAYVAAGWFDRQRHDPDRAAAQRCGRYIDLLMPVVKTWCTEQGNEVADIALQVHGGMGYIEETGVAQLSRDARILTIYEGTTGIQANDLVLRKILREGGATLRELIGAQRGTAAALRAQAPLRALGERMDQDLDGLARSLDWILANGAGRLGDVLGAAVPFLRQLGTVCGSWQMGRAALAAQERRGADAYCQGIVDLARFWFAHHAPQAGALGHAVREGGAAVTAYRLELLTQP